MNTASGKVLFVLALLLLIVAPVAATYTPSFTYYGFSTQSAGTKQITHAMMMWNETQIRIIPSKFQLQTRFYYAGAYGTVPSSAETLINYTANYYGVTTPAARIRYTLDKTSDYGGGTALGTLTGDFIFFNYTVMNYTGADYKGVGTVVYDNISSMISGFQTFFPVDGEINATRVQNEIGYSFAFVDGGSLLGPVTTDRIFSLWTTTYTPAIAAASMSGYTVDAYTNATIPAVLVIATSASGSSSNTSLAGGQYAIMTLNAEELTTISAAKAGYLSPSFEFTPAVDTTYTANISLIPTTIAGIHNGAIDGIVYSSWSTAPIEGATVTVSNATFSDTYTTGPTGFYIFNNLAPGSVYSVIASAPTYSTSSTYSVTTVGGSTVQQDIPLTSTFAVTVNVKDGTYGTFIVGPEVYIQASDGHSANTTFGTVTFTMNGGYYTFTAVTTGYSPGQQSASITADTVVNILMYNTTTPEAAAIRYIPHTVRLVFVNQIGTPIPSARVTATTTESSTPSNWLLDLFGIPSSVGMNTTSLSGTTDSAGSISFAMADILKYDILIYNSTAGFSKNFTIYPKEDQYTFQLNLAPTVANLYDVVKWNLTSYDFSATQVSMNLTYNDSAKQTTQLIFYVNGTMNLTPIYTKTVTLVNGNGSAGLVVTNTKGESLTWGFIAQNSAFGQIAEAAGLTLKGIAGRLIDTGWTADLYLWVSYLILFVVAALFSYANIKFGAIVLPFVAGGLWWIGWLTISWVLLGSLMALGVLVYVNRSEVKVR